MRIPRPRRRALWIGLGALALVLIAAGVLGLGLVRGWFDSGSVEGTTVGFEPAEAPRGQSDAGSWPEFGFDARRTRANPALDLPPPFRRRWSYDAGSLLEFPPVLADGRAIVGTNAGLGLAIDLKTGRELWRVDLRGRVASSPAMAGDLVLFTTKRGGVLALEAATGRLVWRRSLGSASESSPLVVGGSAYLGEISGRVVRLDVRTGGVRWSAKASGPVKASLALTGPNVVVGDYAGRVTAFRRSDGRVVWRTTSPGERLRGPGRFYAGPAVAYGRVYLGNVNGRVVALDEDTGEVAWVRVVGGFVYSSAAVSDRRVFVGSYDHHLRALDAVTGRVVWSVDVGERISGSPSVIGDLVYVSTLARDPADGRTLALDTATGRRVLTFPDGRYSPAVAIRGPAGADRRADALRPDPPRMTITRLARAAAIVAVLGMVSRLLGYFREAVLAGTYGASAQADAFVDALLIVNAFAAILLYALVTLVIPVFQSEREDAGEDSAWRLISALAGWVGVLLVLVSSFCAIWPEAPAALFHLDPERAAICAELIRIMAPALALQGFSALFTAMLQIHGRFAGPAAVGIAFNLGIIGAIVVFHNRIGIEAAAWGVVIGATAQVVLQLPQFARLLRNARARPTFTHPRLGAVAVLALPGAGGVGPPAGEQLHRQALRLVAGERPGGGAELRERARPGPPGGAAAAPDDAALPADRAADVGAARAGGPLDLRARGRAARPGGRARSGS